MKKWLFKLSLVAMSSSSSSLLWLYHWSSIDQGWDHSLWSDRRLPLLSKWWQAQQELCGC